MMAQAATLKPFTALEGAVVHLSDLFEGADARALGPSPAPGSRIVVEAQQLAAIARMFGVEWRPSGPGDRAVLERAGKPLTREDVLPRLRQLLQEAGAAQDSDIELPAFTTAPLPLGIAPTVAFSSPAFDPATGRFTTLLSVLAEGVPPVQMRLSGRVQEMIELPVLRRALVPGEVVGAGDLVWTRLRVGLARGEVVRAAGQAEGQAVRRTVAAGQPIQLADLGRPVIVAKGSPLALSLEGPGITLTAQGVANEPGGLGERIHVTNPYSRAVLEADITGPGQARVVPGSRPADSRSAASQLVAVR
jgi:flagella basal body P-ring formation protein FlgA